MIDDILYIVERYWPLLLEGLKNTIIITAASYSIGVALGLSLALLRSYGPKALAAAVTAYVEAFRGTPMLVQLFIVYYSLPAFGIVLDPLTAAIVAIGLNSGAYQSEYFRGALAAIPRGQWEAALSIGLRKWAAVRYVILPQAWRVALPALTNELIYLLKYSSIAYFVTVPELVFMGKYIGSRTYMYLQVYTVITVIYVTLALTISEGMSRLERRLSVPGVSITGRGQ